MLPSSNIMGAGDKLERSSQKGAFQRNHSGQHLGWLAKTPAEHGCLSNALQFLIANPELEFELSPKRISNLKFSNRKFMTIFQSKNWAASEFQRLPPSISSEKTARSPDFLIGTDDPVRIVILSDQRESKGFNCDPAKILRAAESPNFLIGTDDPARIGILSDRRESKGFGWDPAKTLRTAEPPEFLIGTFDISEKHSNYRKHRPKQISNGHKKRFSRPAWRNNVSAFPSLCVAAQIRESAHA
jgi:hypothetical protein